MKYLNGQYSEELKDHRQKFHPTGNIILRKRDPPKSFRTQYQVQNETQIRKNQLVVSEDNIELKVKNYPKSKRPNFFNQKLNHPIFLVVNKING